MIYCQCENARIWETPNLLTDADRSTNTKKKLFLWGAVVVQRYRETDGHRDGGMEKWTDKEEGGGITFHMSTLNISPVTFPCSVIQCNPQV